METLITIGIMFAAVGLLWLAKFILSKFKLDLDLQIKTLEIIKKGIEFAENYAQERVKALGDKPPSSSKLSMAMMKIDQLSRDNPQVMKYLQDKKEDLIHKVLKSDLTDESLTPKA